MQIHATYIFVYNIVLVHMNLSTQKYEERGVRINVIQHVNLDGNSEFSSFLREAKSQGFDKIGPTENVNLEEEDDVVPWTVPNLGVGTKGRGGGTLGNPVMDSGNGKIGVHRTGKIRGITNPPLQGGPPPSYK